MAQPSMKTHAAEVPVPCPFTGRSVELQHTTLGWIIKGDNYVVGPAVSRGALIKAFSQRIGEEEAPPLKSAIKRLPWSGEDVEVVKVGDQHEWLVRGPKFVMGPFKFEKDAVVAFCTRRGIEPLFKDPKITVAYPEPPRTDDAQDALDHVFPEGRHYDPSIIPTVDLSKKKG